MSTTLSMQPLVEVETVLSVTKYFMQQKNIPSPLDFPRPSYNSTDIHGVPLRCHKDAPADKTKMLKL